MTSVITTRWWWVRHAPIAAPPGTIAGQADLPGDLSDSAGLAALARRLPADALWIATPLARTQATALALGASDLRLEPDFSEQHFGDWQGRTHADVWAADQPTAAAFWADPAHAAPPGGESFAALCHRVAAAVLCHNRTGAGRDIVVIAHAGPIRAAIGQALGILPAQLLSLSVDCLHLTRVDHMLIAGQPDAWRLVGANIPPR
jgi:alpha-ribazole phosphatase